MSDQSTPKSRKLLDQIRDAIRLKHYSYSTEKTYVHWYLRFVRFYKLRHPATMGAPQIQAFLTYLAAHEQVSASTQNQALSALLFLYQEVRDRVSFLPDDELFCQRFHAHLGQVRRFYEAHPEAPVSMPPALTRKYPAAATSWE